jgi:hypothetical protein
MDEKELAEKLASGEYSISPRSGRLRKRIRSEKKKKKSAFYSKKKFDKLLVRIVWILVLIAFLACVFILLPEITETNQKKKNGYQQTR